MNRWAGRAFGAKHYDDFIKDNIEPNKRIIFSVFPPCFDLYPLPEKNLKVFKAKDEAEVETPCKEAQRCRSPETSS